MHLRQAILTVALVLGLTRAGQAASLLVSPIGLEIPSTQRAAILTITNTDTSPVSLQIRSFKWAQSNGDDVLMPTDEIVVSPPAVTIPAGASYTVRVVRPSLSPVSTELSYRVYIDEIPKPIDPRVVAQGVTMVLRTSMPVFVVEKSAIAKLSWQLWKEKSGAIHLEATNAGLRHARLASLSLKLPNGKSIVYNEGLAGYVLAGASKTFVFQAKEKETLPAVPVGSTVIVSAKTNALDINDAVVVGSH